MVCNMFKTPLSSRNLYDLLCSINDVLAANINLATHAPCEQSLFYLLFCERTKHMYRKKRLCLQGATHGAN